MTRLRLWIATLPPGLVESVWLVLTMRIALSIFGLYVASERTIPQPCHFEEARNGWPAMPLQYKDGAAFKLLGIWERWDACWYARIATYGYSPDGSTAFFPLFPALERVVALASPHVAAAGMAINFVATILALWGLFRIVRRDHSENVARRALALIAIFPAAFYLLAPFSEAAFLALAVWSIERARAGDWRTTIVLAALTGVARPVGVTIALPIAWLAWQARADPLASRRIGAVLAVLAAPAAGAAYVLYTINSVGRSMFDAQAEWSGSAFHPPWDMIDAVAQWVGRTGDPLQVLQLAMLVLFTILFAVGIRRLPLELTLLAAPLLYLAWARILPTPLTSTARQLEVVYPAFIVLALLLEDRQWRWSYVVLSLLLLGALANEFVIGNFVG